LLAFLRYITECDMGNKEKSIKNLFFSAVGQIVTIIVGLILPRLYMIEYGSEVNGLLNSLNQFLVYLSLFEAGIGATTQQALYGPVARQDWVSINKVLAATDYYYKRTSKWYLLSLVALTFLYPWIVQSELPYFLISGAVFFSGIGNVFLFRFQAKYKLLLQVDGKNYIITNLTTVLGVGTSLLKAILITVGFNVVFVLASTFAIQMLQVAYLIAYTKRHYLELNLSVVPNLDSLAQRNHMLIHQISGMIFQNTDVLILTIVCGLKTVSVYSVFKLVITYIESILTILINSVNFVLGQTFQLNLEKYKKRIDIFESLYSAMSFALFSVVLFLMLPFVKLYTAGVSDIHYADEKLPVLFVSVALLTCIRVPMLHTINYAGHFKQTLPQSILESAINLTVSLLCVFRFGIYGVLFGTIVALLYRTNDVIIYANRKILNRTPWKTYSIHLINLVVFLFLQFGFGRFFWNVDSIWQFMCAGMIATVISASCFVLAQIICIPHCRCALQDFTEKSRKGRI